MYAPRSGSRGGGGANQATVARRRHDRELFGELEAADCELVGPNLRTGENLWRRQEFADFIVHQGCDILHPDLRNSGGFLENKRIADMAEVWGLPMATHNTGSQLNTWATCQWAGSIRDFIACETVTGKGDWMDELLILDGPYIENGYLRITEKPGFGVDLNPDVAQAHLADGETWWG